MVNPCFKISCYINDIYPFQCGNVFGSNLEKFYWYSNFTGLPWINLSTLLHSVPCKASFDFIFLLPVSQIQTSKVLVNLDFFYWIFTGGKTKKIPHEKRFWIVWLVLIFCSFAVVIQQCLLLVIMLLYLRERRGWWKDIWPIFLMLFPHCYMQHT